MKMVKKKQAMTKTTALLLGHVLLLWSSCCMTVVKSACVPSTHTDCPEEENVSDSFFSLITDNFAKVKYAYEVDYKQVENESDHLVIIRTQMERAIHSKLGNAYLQTDVLEGLGVVGISKDPTDVVLSNVPCLKPPVQDDSTCAVVVGFMTVYFNNDNTDPPIEKETFAVRSTIYDGFDDKVDPSKYEGRVIHSDVNVLRPRTLPLTDENGSIGTTDTDNTNIIQIRYAYELEYDDDDSTDFSTMQQDLEKAINEKVALPLMTTGDGSSPSVVEGVSTSPIDQVLQNVPCTQKQSEENGCVLVYGTLTVYLQQGASIGTQEEVARDAIKEGMEKNEFDNASNAIKDVRYVTLPLTNPETGTFGSSSNNPLEVDYAYELEYTSDGDLTAIQNDLELAINEKTGTALMGSSGGDSESSNVVGVSSDPKDQVLQNVPCTETPADGNSCVLVTGTMTVFLNDDAVGGGDAEKEKALDAIQAGMGGDEFITANDDIKDVRYVFPEKGTIGYSSNNPLEVDYAYELEYTSDGDLTAIQNDLELAINEKTGTALMGSSGGDSESSNVVGVSSDPKDQVLQNVPCTETPADGNSCVLVTGTMTVFLNDDAVGGGDAEKEKALDAIQAGMGGDEFITANDDIKDVRYVTLPLTNPETGTFGSSSNNPLEVDYAYELEYTSDGDLTAIQNDLELAINEKTGTALMGSSGGDSESSNVVGVSSDPKDQVLQNVPCTETPADGNSCVLVTGTMTVFLNDDAVGGGDAEKEKALDAIQAGMGGDEFITANDDIKDVRYVTLPLTNPETGTFGSSSNNPLEVDYAYELEYTSDGDLTAIQNDLELAINEKTGTALMGSSGGDSESSNVVGVSSDPKDQVLQNVPCTETPADGNSCVLVTGTMTVFLNDDAVGGGDAEKEKALDAIQAGMGGDEFITANDDIKDVRYVTLPLTNPETGTFGSSSNNPLEVDYAYELEYTSDGDLTAIQNDLELAINEKTGTALMGSSGGDSESSNVVGVSSDPKDQVLQNVPCTETPADGNSCVLVTGTMTVFLNDDAVGGGDAEKEKALDAIQAGMGGDEFITANDDIKDVRYVTLPLTNPEIGTFGSSSNNPLEVDYAYELEYTSDGDLTAIQNDLELAINEKTGTALMGSSGGDSESSNVVGVSSDPKDQVLQNVPCTETPADGNSCVLVTGTMTVFLNDDAVGGGDAEKEKALDAIQAGMGGDEFITANDDIKDVRYVTLPLTNPETGTFGSSSNNPLEVDYAYELEYTSDGDLTAIQNDLELAINEKTGTALMGSSGGDSESSNVVGVSSDPKDQVLQNVPCTETPADGNSCVLVTGTMTVFLNDDAVGGGDAEKEKALDAIQAGMGGDEFITANDDIKDVRYVTLPLTNPETGLFGSISNNFVEVDYAYELEYELSSNLTSVQNDLEVAINEKAISALGGVGDSDSNNVVGLAAYPTDQIIYNVGCSQMADDNKCVLVKGTMTVYLKNASQAGSVEEDALSVIEQGMVNNLFDSASDGIDDVRYVPLPLTDENGLFGSTSELSITVEHAYEVEYDGQDDLSTIQSDLEQAILEDLITTLMSDSESNVVGISSSPPDLVLEKVPCSQQQSNSSNVCVVIKGEMTVYLDEGSSIADEQQIAEEGIKTGINNGHYLTANDSIQSIRDVPLPLTDENGLFGTETANKLEVEYAYELDYSTSGDPQSIISDLELAMNEDVIPSLMASSDSSVVGVSLSPEDKILGLPCRPQTPGSLCTVIEGSMTVYLEEGAMPGDESALALETIQLGMDTDAFILVNDSISDVRYVESIPSDGLVGSISTNLVEVDYAYELDYNNSTLASQSRRELDEALAKYVASESFQVMESSIVGVSPYPEDYPLYNVPCSLQTDAEDCVLVKAKMTLYLEKAAPMANATQQTLDFIMTGMDSDMFDSVDDNVVDVRYVNLPLTRENGVFGSTSSNYIEVDYAYEMEYDPAGNLTGIQSDLEGAINEKSIPSLMGDPESNVVGVSPAPGDQVLLNVPCSIEATNNACVVVKGTMTVYLKDDSKISDEEQTARGTIESGMNNNEFDLANDSIFNVRYVELPLTDRETGVFGSTTNNSIYVNYAYELEYTAEGDLIDIQSDLEKAINDKIIPPLMSETESAVVGVSLNPVDQVLESIECSQKEVDNNCNLVKGMATVFLKEDSEVGDEGQVAVDAIKLGMDNDEFVSSNTDIYDVRYVQIPLTDTETGTFGVVADNSVEVDYAYELEYDQAGDFQTIQSELEKAINEEVIPAVMGDSSLGVVGVKTSPTDQILNGVPCSRQGDGNNCALMKGALTLYLKDEESDSAEEQAIDAIRSGMDDDRFDSVNESVRDVRYVELPLTDENGLFGTNSSIAVEVDYAYELEFDKGGNLSDIISDAEHAINEEVIPAVMGGSEPSAVGVSAIPDDQVVETVSCSVQPAANNDCMVIMGTVTVYLDDENLPVSTSEEVESSVREAISDAMSIDNDIVSSNDDIRDIRFVSIDTDENGLKGVTSSNPIEVTYRYEVEYLPEGQITEIRPDLERAINDAVLPDIFVASNIVGVGTYPEDQINLNVACREITGDNKCNVLTGILTVYVKDPSLEEVARQQAEDAVRNSMDNNEFDAISESTVDVRFLDDSDPAGASREANDGSTSKNLGYQLGVGLGVPLGLGLIGAAVIYLKKKDDDEDQESFAEAEDIVMSTEVDADAV